MHKSWEFHLSFFGLNKWGHFPQRRAFYHVSKGRYKDVQGNWKMNVTGVYLRGLGMGFVFEQITGEKGWTNRTMAHELGHSFGLTENNPYPHVNETGLEEIADKRNNLLMTQSRYVNADPQTFLIPRYNWAEVNEGIIK